MVYRLITYCLFIFLNERLASKRSEIIQSLKQKGIGSGIYYLQSVHHLNMEDNEYMVKSVRKTFEGVVK